MTNPNRDRLIDMLLREELGGESPPDLTEAIVRRAMRRSRSRYVIAALTWSAVAALVLIGVFVWLRPRADNSQYQLLVDGQPAERGTQLRSNVEEIMLEMGGYSRVEIAPHSSVRLEGGERQEAIFLERGAVVCSITRDKGSFTVRTAVGTVSVAGTQFQVRVVEEPGEAMNKKMLVRVLVGAVLVGGAWGVVHLGAGNEQLFAQEKPKEKNPLEGKKGKVVGTVVNKGDAFIEIKGAGEEEGRKYFPEWKGGAPAQGGGFDKTTLKAFREVKIGSRVEVDWVFHERLRALKVTVLQAAKND